MLDKNLCKMYECEFEAVSPKDIMGSSIKKGDKIYITGIKKETATYTIWNDKEHNGGYVFPFEVIENNTP